jgi:nucleotide-binding universal stress UspA family protein
MKTILVPLDFSEPSDNALEYAVGVANKIKASIILLHTEQMPVASYELEPVAYTLKNSIEFNTNLLLEKAKRIKKIYPFIQFISCNVELGDLNSNIDEYIEKKNVDLIIMGITGKTSTLSKVVFGSNAITISRKASIPVIIVPNNCKYSGINNIAYACDYREHAEISNDLIEIKNITEIFNALLNVIHIIPDGHLLSEAEVETDNYIESQLENINHRTFIFPRNNIVATILKFIEKQKVDLIVLEQSKHSFFHEIFYPSITKDIAFSSPIPVMTLNKNQ